MDDQPLSAEGKGSMPGEPAPADLVRPYPQRSIFSFIIKIWIDQAYSGAWHGYISGVPDGSGHYFRSFSQVGRYIRGYLLAAGIRLMPGWLARLHEWIRSSGKQPPEQSI